MKIVLLPALLFLSSCTIMRSRNSVSIPEKEIVLTFDDGPNEHAGTTSELLDVLRKHNVRAHFSLIGQNAILYPELTRRILNEGHNIVIHGYTDQLILFKNEEEITSEIVQFENALSSITGSPSDQKLTYFRPAYGFYNKNTPSILDAQDLTILPVTSFQFDAEYGPGKKEKMIQRILRDVRKDKGGIIVLHDGKDNQEILMKKVSRGVQKYDRSWVPEAVDSLITILSSEGYRFRLMSCDDDINVAIVEQ